MFFLLITFFIFYINLAHIWHLCHKLFISHVPYTIGTMTREGYVGISIPRPIMKDVDQIVKNNISGYTSRAEFFKDAARQLINKINGNGQASQKEVKKAETGWESTKADEAEQKNV